MAIDAPARAALGDNSEIDYALSLGANQALSTPDANLLDLSANFTMEFWYKTDSIASRMILNKETSYEIGTDANGKFGYALMSGGVWDWHYTTAVIPNGRWVHVSFTKASTVTKLYFDGQQVWTQTGGVTTSNGNVASNPATLDNQTSYFMVGGRANVNSGLGSAVGQGAGSTIDELKIWNTERTQANIAASMHEKATSGASGLVAYWNFNEGTTSNSAASNFDRSGNNLHLTFFGTPTSSNGNFVDVKSVTRTKGQTVVTFPRTYLPGVAGWTVPATATRARVLVVGGGGAGGSGNDNTGGGGGGAGGITENVVRLTSGSLQTVKVGQGGIPDLRMDVKRANDGTTGQSTSFGSTQVLGGGGGAGRGSRTGLLGASSGGSSGTATGTAGTTGQGNAGGAGGGSYSAGGGGGGATSAGSTGGAFPGNGGAGGAGKSSVINAATYSAGGAGGSSGISNGTGTGQATVNSGNGGAGGNATSGTPAAGGGGAYGGSGVVIVAYASEDDKALDITSSSTYASTSSQFFPSSTSQDFTFEAWIKPDSIPANHAPIFTTAGDNNFTSRFYLGTYDISSAKSKLYVAIGSGNDVASARSLAVGEWNHIAISVQGTALKIYLNGFLDKSATVPRVSHGSGFRAGYSSNSGTTQYFDGQIDQVKLWHSTLDQAAIARSMHAHTETDGAGQIDSNLQHAYDFNEEVSGVFEDFNGSANLTKTGSPTLQNVVSTTSSSTNSTFKFPRTVLNAFGGWFSPVANATASALVVGAGGGGGKSGNPDPLSAGSGAGGAVYPVASLTLPSDTVSIIVGQGGAGSQSNTGTGNRGGLSALGTLKVAGGAGGNSYLYTGTTQAGEGGSDFVAGGNGGGGRQENGASSASYALGGQAGTASNQTFNGATFTALSGVAGSGDYSLDNGSGGLGGQSAVRTSSISGASVEYGKRGLFAPWDLSLKTLGSGGTTNYGYGSGTTSDPGEAGANGVVFVSLKTANAVSFDANGGSGTLAAQYINIGSSANLSANTFTRTGFTFDGWATSANGSVVHADGASVTPSGDLALYAVWTSDLPSVNVAFDELNFDFTNILHVVGTTGKSLGNKVLFRNVTTKGGIQVDALVTTKTLSGSTIENYESGTGAGGAASYFQIDTKISAANGYAEFQFDFYQHGVSGNAGDPCKTNNTSCTGATKVKLQNVNVSAIDIDYLQWNDFTGVESYTMAANGRTKLFECAIPNTGTCASRVAPSTFPSNMRFQGSADSNRTNSPQDMVIVSYAEIESFTIKFGRSASSGTVTNFFGVAFKALSWGADTPATVGGTTYSVTYNANTGSGNVPSSSTGVVGSNVTMPGAGSLSKTGYTFGGWMTAADGSGTTYAESTVISMPLGGQTLYAKWTANQYMLIYKLYGGLNGPATEMRSTGAVANLSSTQPTRDGAVFSSWNTAADGSGTTYSAGASFTMPGANTTLHAMYTTATGTIAYNANNGSSAPASTTNTSGTTVAAAGAGSMTRTNYTFSSWNTAADGTGTDYSAGANVPYPGNGLTTTLYAQWTPILYSYSYNANGGTGAPTGGSTTAGATVTIPSSTTTRTGYTFAGWTTAADGTGTVYTNGGANPSLTMPGANTVLYAKWTAITYTLAFNSNDAGAGANPSSVTGNYGANLTAAAAPTAPTGKKFNGWNTVANGSGSTIAVQGTYQITADTTLYAQWVADTVNLFYNANGGSGAPTSTTASANQDTTLSGTAPNRIGFSFSGWTTAANGSGTVYGISSTFPVPGSDTTLYAKWTPIGYNFIYSANGGSGSPATVAYNMGDFVVIDNTGTTVRTGYTFAGWNTLADGTGSDYLGGQNFLMSNSNMTMYAKWTSNPYTLTYNANLGAGSPTAETRNAGASAILSSTAPTRTGYTFNGWNTAQNGSGSSYNSSASYTMPTSNATLYAQWTANSNAVSYNANNGSGAPSGGTFSFGATVTVSNTAPTRTGYTFLGWNTAANGSGTNYSAADTFAMPNSSVTLYAKWSILQKSVTYDANGGTGVDAVASYNYGATVTVSTAQVSRSGYSFIGWNTLADGSGTSRAASSTFTMPETDLTFYAIWSINAYTVYYNMNGGTGSVTPQPGNYGSSVIVSTTVPTRLGYTFSGWNTLAPGNGFDYTGGGTLSIPASNLTLFAKWTPIMYSVSFNANGGSGSPADVTGLTAGNNTTLSVTVPVQNGYVFNGWNTAVDGSGQTHSGGQNFVVPAANTVLYAQWVANTYEIIYNANGGANAPVPANGSTNATVTLTSGSVTRAGYTHLGWSTNSGATTATYYGPSNLSFVVPAGNTILYAVWALADITLTYNINNGSGLTPSAFTDKYLETTVLSPSSAFSRSGYTFTGWNTAADGSGSSYADEANFVMPNANKTLYAQWSAIFYAVEYSANGGSNAPANQFAIPGATVAVPTSEPVKSGYEFNDWTEVAAGTTVTPGATLTMPSSNVVLVANWVTAASVPSGSPSANTPSPSPSPSASPVKKKLTQTVYFKGDSAVLQTKAKQQLKALATKAVTYGYALRIQVTGRVKETNDKSYDMRLSRQRAQNVANYLKTLKVKGKWVVIAAGISPENKAISRRVDLTLFW